MFRDKNILITGGTGSFGFAFLNYIVKKKIPFKEIRILSRDEKKQDDLRKIFNNNNNIKFYIGDVRDKESLTAPIKNSHFIFHAAALKQVPSCEFYPIEAFKTNVQGTNNVLAEAIYNGVRKVICLSTDKAVYPINAMGISKAMMEKIAISKSLISQNSTKICITRYGNVLGSRGSIVPLIINQIKNNKPVTITNPNMTRFLMPMRKAIELIIFALINGNNGDIFIQKTPAARIGDLTLAIMRLMNKPKHKIKYIGSRHGEKIHESLLTTEEMAKAKVYKKYFRVSSDIRNLNYDNYFTKGVNKKRHHQEYSSATVENLKINQIIKLLKKADLEFFI
jgi:UDP-glucose 4-epimerase